VESLITVLGDLPAPAVYVVAALLVFAETGLIVGLVLPGEVTLLFVGFLAYAGALHPVPAAVVMTVAALAGDAVAYAEGRRTGPRLRTTRLGRWVGDDRWDRTATLLQRHGGRAIFAARFVAFARTLMPRLAAMSGQPYRRVLGWDALGVVVQVASSVALGYLVGGSYALAAEYFGRATGALLLLVLVIVGLIVFGRYIGRHPDPVTAFGDRIGAWGPLRLLDQAYDALFRWLTARLGVGGAVAVNVLLGVGLLLGLGAGLTWAIDSLISTSGFPLVDAPISTWFADRRTPGTTEAALTTLSVLRGSFLVAAAGVVGIALNRRRPAHWRADLLGIVGTVGAFIPLVILAIAADWARPADDGGTADVGLFPNQVTLVTASVGMVAWLLTRQGVPWAGRVAAWTGAVGLVLIVSAARLYVGWDWPSEIFASVLLGALWVVVFAVAWRTRDRVRAGETTTEPYATEAAVPR
jgi:membrane protein DedA with SNARE-associated domain